MSSKIWYINYILEKEESVTYFQNLIGSISSDFDVAYSNYINSITRLLNEEKYISDKLLLNDVQKENNINMNKNNRNLQEIQNYYYEEYRNANRDNRGNITDPYYRAFVITTDTFYYYDSYLVPDENNRTVYDQDYVVLFKLEVDIQSYVNSGSTEYAFEINSDSDFDTISVELPAYFQTKYNCSVSVTNIKVAERNCPYLSQINFLQNRFYRYFGRYSINVVDLSLEIHYTSSQQRRIPLHQESRTRVESQMILFTKDTYPMSYFSFYIEYEPTSSISTSLGGIAGGAGVIMEQTLGDFTQFNFTTRNRTNGIISFYNNR